MSEKLLEGLVRSYKAGNSDATRLQAARELLELAETTDAALYQILEHLEQGDGDLRRRIVDMLPAFVLRIANILLGEQDALWWCDHSDVCNILAELGDRARAAVPVLVQHTEDYPRFELNAWALASIGGKDAVQSLNRWTWFQGENHDRKRTDMACGSLSSLGQPGIDELMKLADSEDELERTRALLNLHEYTACPSEVLKPLLSKGIERGSNQQWLLH